MMAGQPWRLLFANVVTAAQKEWDNSESDGEETEEETAKRKGSGDNLRKKKKQKQDSCRTPEGAGGGRASPNGNRFAKQRNGTTVSPPEAQSSSSDDDSDEEEDGIYRTKTNSSMFTNSEVKRMNLVKSLPWGGVDPEEGELTFRVAGEKTAIVYDFPGSNVKALKKWRNELWLAIENQRRLLAYSRSLEDEIGKLNRRMAWREKMEGKGKAAMSDTECKDIKYAIERHMFRTRKFVLVSMPKMGGCSGQKLLWSGHY